MCGSVAIDKSISIVYTPLNGAGRKCVVECLERNSFTNVSVVGEQGLPDDRFPTCPYPNPEIKETLELGNGKPDRGRLWCTGLDVLTGFKYIGEQIGLLEKEGEADRLLP